MRPRLPVVLTVVFAATLCVWTPSAHAAGRPTVAAALEGRESGTGRAIVTLVGKRLTKITAVAVLDGDQMQVGTAEILSKTATDAVLRLPEGLAAGSYTLAVSAGSGEPIAVAARATGEALLADGSNAMTGLLRSTSDDGVLFGGTSTVGADPPSGPGVRMFWYPKKYAFRAGMAVGDEWDPANIDAGTVAIGRDCRTRFSGSTAIGNGTFASDSGAVAIGSQVTGDAGGVAIGVGCNAVGSSVAIGAGNTATGFASTALGLGAQATGSGSFAAGIGPSATGRYAACFGVSTVAQSYGSLVIGSGNVIAGTTTSVVATDPLFVCGNGTSAARSNALTLFRNGDLTISGTLSQNSDARLKKDVTALVGVGEKLAKLRGVSYAFADATKHPEGRHIGLLAQEVREAFPELVTEGPDGTLSVAYGNLAAVLVEAVKEQSAKLADRDREISSLRKEQAELAERLARLEKALAK